MDEAFKKITHYQLFNFLLTGAVFCVLVSTTTSINLIHENIIAALAIYYFVGLIISRIGSLFIGRLLKKIKFVKFSSYKDYLATLKKDPSIDILSQENNMYRTFVAVFVVYLVVFLCNHFFASFIVTYSIEAVVVGAVSLATLFAFSYRKQTGFIDKRIEYLKAKK